MLFLCIAFMLIRTGGHFVCACVHPKNDNSVGASNMMVGNRKLPLSYSPLKAISLVPYFPTKNVLHDKNRTFSMRVFSCRFFSSRFSWPFQDLKDWAPKITVPVSDLSFTGKAMHFNVLVRYQKQNHISQRVMTLLVQRTSGEENYSFSEFLTRFGRVDDW